MDPTMDCDVLVGNSVVIGQGDPLTFSAGGVIAYVNQTDVIMGVYDSSKYSDSSGIEQWDGGYLPASQVALATVYWHPMQMYRVQGGNLALAQTHRSLNAQVSAFSAADSFLKRSKAYLDTVGTAPATTNTLGWKILDWERTAADGQSIGETYPIYLVMNNRSFWANQIAGI